MTAENGMWGGKVKVGERDRLVDPRNLLDLDEKSRCCSRGSLALHAFVSLWETW